MAPNSHKTSHATGGSDALSPSDIGAEKALGNPLVDGYVLASTKDGVRSWVNKPDTTIAAATDFFRGSQTAYDALTSEQKAAIVLAVVV